MGQPWWNIHSILEHEGEIPIVDVGKKITAVQKRGHAAPDPFDINAVLWVGTFVELDKDDFRPYGGFGQMFDDRILGALDIEFQQIDRVVFQHAHDRFESVTLRLEPIRRALQVHD